MRKFIPLFLLVLSSVSAFAQDGARRDALVLYRQQDFQGAIQVCLAELAANPGNMNSYSVLGWSYLRLKDYSSALKYANEAMSTAKYDYRIIEIAGEANYYLGKSADALKLFEQYVVLAPQGDRIELVYYFMGEIFLQMGEYHRADIAFTTAIYHAPNTAKWWERLGFARLQAKDFRYAKAAYDQALKLNPNSADAKRGQAQALQAQTTPGANG